MRGMVLGLGLVAMALLAGSPSRAQGVDDVVIVDGACLDSSRLAEGPADADLTASGSRYRCDTVVIMEPGPGRLLVQFVDKKSDRQTVLGFVLTMDEQHPDVGHVAAIYFQPGQRTPVEDGACKLFYRAGRLTGVACSGRAVKEGRASAAIVAFDATK